MRIRSFALAVLLAAHGLAGCGGSSDDDDIGQQEPAWNIDGKVVDSNGQGIAGATVSIPLNGRLYRETTAANGEYRLRLPRSEGLPRYFAGVIARDGYLPQTVHFQFENGQLAVGGASPALATATAADIIFPEGLTVIHLGDDNFGGAINSQLQVPTLGIGIMPRFTLSETQKANYSSLTISFHGRGIQTNESGYCNQIVVASTEPGTSVAPDDPNRQFLQDSHPSGAYTAFSYRFNLASLREGENAVHVYSGRKGCLATSGDADDFEITTLTGKLS